MIIRYQEYFLCGKGQTKQGGNRGAMWKGRWVRKVWCHLSSYVLLYIMVFSCVFCKYGIIQTETVEYNLRGVSYIGLGKVERKKKSRIKITAGRESDEE